MLVYLIDPPKTIQETVYTGKQKGEVVDPRGLIDRIFGWNKDQIYISQGEGYKVKARTPLLNFVLKFDMIDWVPLGEKIPLLEISGMKFHGVIPQKHLDNGTTICTCDYYTYRSTDK